MAVLTGTLLNAATVLIGGLVGTVVGDRLPERLRENVVRGVGLFVTAMGVKFAIETTNLLYMLGAILLDGFTAIALAATLGWGVLLTVPLILVYQGGLALGASLFAGVLSDLQLREMSAVGGLLLIGVGLKLLAIRDVKVADFLPAIVVSPLVVVAFGRLLEAMGQ